MPFSSTEPPDAVAQMIMLQICAVDPSRCSWQAMQVYPKEKAQQYVHLLSRQRLQEEHYLFSADEP